MEIPLRETVGASLADLEKIVQKSESELPSTFASIIPVILPILLISLASTFDAVDSLKHGNEALYSCVQFAGKGYPVMEMDGGFEAWQDNELETEKGNNRANAGQKAFSR